MKLVVRKLEILDVDHLRSLVIEHLDGIEPGITVLDSKLQMGQAIVDIVALDTDGALVLVTAGFTADEQMLLKAVEAYSWCLEYPDAVRRLYPAVDISATRPPRLMFVVERLPDAFHRKIKQLGFSEMDCVEFRHLDVSGTPAVYFDTIARLRRGSPYAEFQPAPISRRVSEPQGRHTPEPMIAERPVDKSGEHGDKVVPLLTGPTNARSTSVRMQKMLSGQAHGNAAPVIDLATRTAVAAQRIEVAAPSAEIAPRAAAVAPALEIEHVGDGEPATTAVGAAEASVDSAAPVIDAAAPMTESPEPRISFAEAAKDLLAAPAPTKNAPNESEAKKGASAIVEPKKLVAPAPKRIVPAIKPVEAPTKPIAPAAKPIAPATKPVVAGDKPAAAAPAIAAAPKKPGQNPPQKLDGLKFPDDGVLTRQWMDFLNQMVSGK